LQTGHPDEPKKYILLRYSITAAGLIALAAFSMLYAFDRGTYHGILSAVIQVPWSRPFVDWEAVYSSIQCSKLGINVFITNPCYTAWGNAPSDYSPLWLYATFIPVGLVWGSIVALSLCILFFISLALLPSPRNWTDLAVCLFATLSSAVVLGIERGNADLLMFLMVITGTCLGVLQLPFRFAGYGLFALAGLLKFYPMVALIMVVRERFIVFLAVAIVTLSLLTLLVVMHFDDMLLMYQNLPTPSYFNLQWGSANLPAGLGHVAQVVLTRFLHVDPTTAGTVGLLTYTILWPVLTIVAVVTAIWASARWRLQDALSEMPPRHAAFFVVGAAIICGCFFVGQSVVYRGVHLLLAVPGLLALSHDLPNPRARTIFRVISLAVVYVQWALFLQWLIKAEGLGDVREGGSIFGYGEWLCNEVAWWSIATGLLSVLVTFVFSSEQWAVLSRVLRLSRSWHADQVAIASFRG